MLVHGWSPLSAGVVGGSGSGGRKQEGAEFSRIFENYQILSDLSDGNVEIEFIYSQNWYKKILATDYSHCITYEYELDISM